MTAPRYPNVGCSTHLGDPQPGYVVCVHVLQGVEVAYRELATPKQLGQILCAACHAAVQVPPTDASVVCCHCAREYGLLPVVH